MVISCELSTWSMVGEALGTMLHLIRAAQLGDCVHGAACRMRCRWKNSPGVARLNTLPWPC